ncbi:MAG: hypothetical protein RH860_12415 [Cytophagales bacterium]
MKLGNFILVYLLLLFLHSCKDDSGEPTPQPCNDPTDINCPNYDPCFEKSPVKADFTISGALSNVLPYVDSFVVDTAFHGGQLKFEAVDKEADYYKWYLGTEIVEGPNEHTVFRTINNLSKGIYTAALMLQKSPDSVCFPFDDGIDSTNQIFTKVDICDLAVVNKFKGVYESNPEDSITLEIINWNEGQNEYCTESSRIHVINFGGNKDTLMLLFDIVGLANSVLIANNPPLGGLDGRIDIDVKNSTVSAFYRFYNDSTYKQFNGIITE